MKFGLYIGDIVISKFWVGWGFANAYQTQTGPYRIERITGPCTCAPYNINYNLWCNLPSEPHFHLECTDIRPGRKGSCYLNGYLEREGRFLSAHEGQNPYTGEPNDKPADELFLVERGKNVQFDLFK